MTRLILCGCLVALSPLAVLGQAPAQPDVQPGPNEPNWIVLLQEQYGLRMYADLANPVEARPESVRGLFRKAGDGPVTYRPLIALGLETTTRGGWYPRGDGQDRPGRRELWSYTFKNTTADLETGSNLPPPLASDSKVEFDPGNELFGVWVANDQFDDGGVYSQPAVVKAVNARLAAQPYKAMIYPYKDKSTGKIVPHSYLIGWEYSTNDDFQDVVCRIDNVELVGEP